MDNLPRALGTLKVIYDEETIRARVKELGNQIQKDYEGDELVVIGVIRGSMYFLADLTRSIDLPLKLDMIGFSNIPDTTSRTGVVRIIKDIDIDITGKRVLVVEDVIRTGLTTAYIIQNLEMKKPKDITLCTMLLNPDRLLMTVPVKYYGFEINDLWLAGYGLDIDEVGRNLPYIAQIRKR
ncbi:MAG: hypoxanthine phosphoribosyltransferase [Mageeibacillus sp.]|jgi:hypoxanthine phosphoribosyltransferase|nr:hypoxanthine phosphoribosyltransferase [Mageeibacillus sp.]MCI1264198.1 hypoxanthine phosphoribosyltransferase [Saccharofermentans sp.]MCI1769420.1 hypoxanthine phosphoribosyltransferase [Mageeibacillus sp.]MCI2044291.1 hypoxanthine phosphoribosyltransferase [Mageeibacillus sp.]